jgi:methylated-DNA-[protein]-cysteine S-methyltransferase
VASDLTLRHATVPTPFGPFTIVASGDGVVATTTGDPRELVDELARRLGTVSMASSVATPRVAALRAATRDLDAYFAGRRGSVETPVDLRLVGTPFARAVLEVTRTIPYAELWTYGDVAAAAGRPGAARTAGSALARCPIEIFVPCHRVVPAGPGLGTYGGADDRRVTLLRFEGAI